MIFKPYSRRREEEQEKNDYLLYDHMPIEFRRSVFIILEEIYSKLSFTLYRELAHELRKYTGKNLLSNNNQPYRDIEGFFLKDNQNIENVFDTMEFSFQIIIKHIETGEYGSIRNLKKEQAKQYFIKKIEEINDFFSRYHLGYEINRENFHIIRKDTEFLHKEVIKQTITLLRNQRFEGPLNEFNQALDHYLKKEYQDAILDANKAFESTMKSILSINAINFPENINANALIQKLKENDFLMPYLENFTNNLRSMLESSIPTIRNRESGHGSGIDPKKIEKSYAQLGLHLSGSFIVFLIERHYEKNQINL